MKPIEIREHESLTGKIADNEIADFLKSFADQPEDKPALIYRTKNSWKVKNYVGILPLSNNKLVEIYPKIPLLHGDATKEEEKEIFYKMLRRWRGFGYTDFGTAGINKLKNYTLWEVFIFIFLQHVSNLVKRGIISRYETETGNLPYLKGRLLFPQQAVINSVNKARFYVQYDTYTPDIPTNRLIRKTLDWVKGSRLSNERQRRQLIACFDTIQPSKDPIADWQRYQRHHGARNLRHYADVMHWVELLLWKYGLTTYSGDTNANALLFPMEQVFEDFVAHYMGKQLKNEYIIKTQKPQKTMLYDKNSNSNIFNMKPDIYLEENKENGKKYILDTKWKFININDRKNQYGMQQSDVYQLYSYGKQYGCDKVILLYPENENFREAIEFTFQEEELQSQGEKLQLLCLPFNLAEPEDSVKNIREKLNSSCHSTQARHSARDAESPS